MNNPFIYMLSAGHSPSLGCRIVVTFPNTWPKPRAVWGIRPSNKTYLDMYNPVYGFRLKSFKQYNILK